MDARDEGTGAQRSKLRFALRAAKKRRSTSNFSGVPAPCPSLSGRGPPPKFGSLLLFFAKPPHVAFAPPSPRPAVSSFFAESPVRRARKYDMISMPTPNHLFAPETPRGCGSRYHFAAARSTTALISHSNPTSEQSEQSPLAVGTPEGKRNGSEAHQPSEFITAMGPVTAMRIISGNL